MKTTWKTIALIMIPAIIAALTDGLLTMLGQTDWNNVAEASPMARPFLALGPLAWILFVLGYICIFTAPALITGIFSWKIVMVYSIFLTITHLIGIYSWIGIFLPGGLEAVELYAMIPALIWFIFSSFFLP